MAIRRSIRFLRRGKVVQLTDVPPMATLLDYLRLEERACGTKEGCGEGDCGACTVALGSLRDGRVVYEPVNSCIQLLGMMDGKEVVAVDDLHVREGGLHPVQRAMVATHGSQCGFCTPGFVMSLFALYHADGAPDRAEVNDAIAGNLCRCTGYRPIVEAGLKACAGTAGDSYAAAAAKTAKALGKLADGKDVFIGNDKSFFAAPASAESLAKLYAAHPDAVLVAGATDVGLWITKQLRSLPKIIHLGRAADLAGIADNGDSITIGAAVTYEAAAESLAAIDPDLGELLRRLGSKQVRTAGTVCGNIANGSPIGDTPPALIVLGATVELRAAGGTRDPAAGEVLHRLWQAGPSAGRIRRVGDRAEAAAEPGLPRLQDLQALRPGYLGAAGRLLPDAGWQPDRGGAYRLWWHGADAETRPARGSSALKAPT